MLESFAVQVVLTVSSAGAGVGVGKQVSKSEKPASALLEGYCTACPHVRSLHSFGALCLCIGFGAHSVKGGRSPKRHLGIWV